MKELKDVLCDGHTLIRIETKILNRFRVCFLLSWSPDELSVLTIRLLNFYNMDYMRDFVELFVIRAFGAVYAELVVSWD